MQALDTSVQALRAAAVASCLLLATALFATFTMGPDVLPAAPVEVPAHLGDVSGAGVLAGPPDAPQAVLEGAHAAGASTTIASQAASPGTTPPQTLLPKQLVHVLVSAVSSMLAVARGASTSSIAWYVVGCLGWLSLGWAGAWLVANWCIRAVRRVLR